MAENKTKPTSASADDYIAAIADENRRSDCQALIALMAKATKQPPTMWGTSIVGFGLYKYQLSSGKLGEFCTVGFSSRKGDISIYGVTGSEGADALLEKLGKHKLGKGCLYIRSMADIDATVLKKLIAQAFKAKNST